MRKFVLISAAICMFQIGFAQNKNQEVDMVSHSVQLGETVRMLSKKYLVDPSEIYRYNKFAVNGISQGMVLQIPVPRKEPVVQQEETPETVAQTETQTQEPPVESEPARKPKPAKAKPAEPSVSVISRDAQTDHTVEAGETLYSLSRKYGVSVDEIKMSNDGGLKKGLKVGQVVKIPSVKMIDSTESSIGSTVTPTREVSQDKPVAASQESDQAQTADASASDGGTINHKVAPKETLYSLSKRYNITVDDIKAQNPDVAKHGLQIGQTLIIRKN